MIYRPPFVAVSLLENCLDAFLVTILPIAMMSERDLKVAGRVSEKLFTYIVDSIIPLMSNNTETYNTITITTDEIVAFSHTTYDVCCMRPKEIQNHYTIER